MIRITEQYGIIQARRTSAEPSVPGALVASASHGPDGWYVSHRGGGGLHLMYAAGADEAWDLLALVAGELA